MSVPVVTFFNNKGGVGKTSLVYHLSWMLADLGHNVLAADLDPQANLTSAFLSDDRLEQLWPEAPVDRLTIHGALRPLIRGIGDIVEKPHVEEVAEGLHLLVGDLELAGFEDQLAQEWPKALDRQERSFRVLSAIWRILQKGAANIGAEVVLMDLGPNLGAINRAAMIASDFLVVPLAPDLFSLQGLRNLGPTLQSWQREWRERRERNPDPQLDLPEGAMEPLGYVVLQHAVRLDRPVAAYQHWIERIPGTYDRYISGDQDTSHRTFDSDPDCLAMLKHYRSLVPMAQEARKPIFHLRYADGAIGAHVNMVEQAGRDFEALAQEIWRRAGGRIPADDASLP